MHKMIRIVGGDPQKQKVYFVVQGDNGQATVFTEQELIQTGQGFMGKPIGAIGDIYDAETREELAEKLLL